MRESEREREHGVLTVTPAFLVILKVGLEDEDKVGINDKDDASFCSFSEKCQNKSLVGQFGDLAIGSSLQKKKKKCYIQIFGIPNTKNLILSYVLNFIKFVTYDSILTNLSRYGHMWHMLLLFFLFLFLSHLSVSLTLKS